MKLNIAYIDHEREFIDNIINVIEIENKKYFYRLITDIYNLSNSNEVNDLTFFSEELSELNYAGKVKVFFNYIDFDFNSKKYINDIFKLITLSMKDEHKDAIIKQYNKLMQLYSKEFVDIDIPLTINSDGTIETINKIIKIEINNKNNLLDNLLLLIDLEKTIKTHNILVFVNLKQYLEKEELIELYKYSIYNQITIILIDSQSYGITLEYEKKLIIDSNMDEFVI